MKNLDQTYDVLLSEILPLPANKTVENRFDANMESEATCSGKCRSGVCVTVAN